MSEHEKMDKSLEFWTAALSDPDFKEININRFIAAMFRGVALLDDRDGALATLLSEVDTHDLIGKLWKGVGKLDDESAKIVCGETCKVCYENWTDRDLIMEYLGYDTDKPSIPGACCAHEKLECAIAEGPHATVTDNGDGTATAVTQSGDCVCYFYRIYGLIEPHRNHCHCTKGALEGLYTNLLGKPVSVEFIESYARGADRCAFKIKLPESLD